MLYCPSLYERNKMGNEVLNTVYIVFAIFAAAVVLPLMAVSYYVMGRQLPVAGWSKLVIASAMSCIITLIMMPLGLHIGVLTLLATAVMSIVAWVVAWHTWRLARQTDKSAALQVHACEQRDNHPQQNQNNSVFDQDSLVGDALNIMFFKPLARNGSRGEK